MARTPTVIEDAKLIADLLEALSTVATVRDIHGFQCRFRGRWMMIAEVLTRVRDETSG